MTSVHSALPVGEENAAPPAPLGPGVRAPEFALPLEAALAGDGAATLSDLKGQPVVLAFSPPEWNPSHDEQIALFYNALVSALRPAGGDGDNLVGVSVDGMWCDLAFADREQVRFPLIRGLSPHGPVADAYGVGGERALFVLDGDGVIRWSQILSPDAPPRAEHVLVAVRALGGDTSSPPPVMSQDEKAAVRDSSGTFRATRREFVAAALAGALALAFTPVASYASGAPTLESGAPQQPRVGGPNVPSVPVTLKINGTEKRLALEPRVALLDALRENAGLTGTKKGCDHGQCGACTVHRNGERILSCLTLAVMCEGDEITTIEGLAKGDTLHPVQAAFIEHDGFQCGYCTPGQIMSGAALLTEGRYKTDAELREGMSGNLCRCGAYVNIITALKAARDGRAVAQDTPANETATKA